MKKYFNKEIFKGLKMINKAHYIWKFYKMMKNFNKKISDSLKTIIKAYSTTK